MQLLTTSLAFERERKGRKGETRQERIEDDDRKRGLAVAILPASQLSVRYLSTTKRSGLREIVPIVASKIALQSCESNAVGWNVVATKKKGKGKQRQ